jgi:hypothetical protein
MGGDDLGSDDEQYLTARATIDDSASNDDGNRARPTATTTATATARRNRDAGAEEDIVDSGPQQKKSKRDGDGSSSGGGSNMNREQSGDGGGHGNLFRQALHVANQSPRQQAAFLQQAMRRYYSTSDAAGSAGPGSKDILPAIHPSYFASFSSEQQEPIQAASFLDKLRSAVSNKKLKNWGSHPSSSPAAAASPCVIVVCISARRAVSILQELAPLKIRVAKLFPKNGSVREQLDLLRPGPGKGGSNSCSVAVGTPHRLLVLAEELSKTARGASGAEGGRPPTPMTDRTQLVILDGHASSNQSTVFTMADTAPHCMKFLVEHVLPQLQARKDLKLAFF